MRKKLAPSQGKPLNPWTKKPKPSSHLMRRDPPPSLLIWMKEGVGKLVLESLRFKEERYRQRNDHYQSRARQYVYVFLGFLFYYFAVYTCPFLVSNLLPAVKPVTKYLNENHRPNRPS